MDDLSFIRKRTRRLKWMSGRCRCSMIKNQSHSSKVSSLRDKEDFHLTGIGSPTFLMNWEATKFTFRTFLLPEVNGWFPLMAAHSQDGEMMVGSYFILGRVINSWLYR